MAETVPLEVILRSSMGGGSVVVVSVALKGGSNALTAAQLSNLLQQLTLMRDWLLEDDELAKKNACRHPRNPIGECVVCGDGAALHKSVDLGNASKGKGE